MSAELLDKGVNNQLIKIRVEQQVLILDQYVEKLTLNEIHVKENK